MQGRESDGGWVRRLPKRFPPRPSTHPKWRHCSPNRRAHTIKRRTFEFSRFFLSKKRTANFPTKLCEIRINSVFPSLQSRATHDGTHKYTRAERRERGGARERGRGLAGGGPTKNLFCTLENFFCFALNYTTHHCMLGTADFDPWLSLTVRFPRAQNFKRKKKIFFFRFRFFFLLLAQSLPRAWNWEWWIVAL